MGVKQVFRHLCAELDGFYVKAFVYFLNDCMDDMRALFYYMRNMQVCLEEDASGGTVAISSSDMEGIGNIAGVFIPYITAESSAGSIRFTSSNIVNDVQYSERGLFNRDSETFEFFRTNDSTYSDDINTLATTTLQSSVVEPGVTVIGYIPENTDVLNDDGTVDESKLLSEYPTDQAAYPYYGGQYLHLSEEFEYETYMTYEVYYYLVLAMQRIRYSGASIKEFLYITELIMEDYATDLSFTSEGNYIIVYYTLDTSSELEYKLQKTYTWKNIISQKFPQIALVENS